jgi:diguanylate cyclase (GGDEF)-like protein
LLTLAAGLAVIMAYFVLPYGGTAQAAIQVAMCAASATAAAGAAARTRGLARVVWVWHAVGLTFLTMGTGLLYAYPFVAGRPLPYPSPADALVLAMYPCLGVALWALARLTRGEDHRGDILDVVIMVGGIGALVWVSAVGPVVHTRGLPLLAHVVSVSYAVADLTLFAMLVRLLVGSRRSGAMRMLATASGLMATADTLLVFQLASGGPQLGVMLDCLYLLNCVFLVAAAVHPTALTFTAGATATTHRLDPSRMIFLGASLLVCPVLLASRPADAVLIAALAVLTFVAVLARMSRLNRRLDEARRSVEDKSAQLRHQASHDALTGLPNRALIMDRLEHLLARSPRHGSSGATAMFIDLDGFKNVNDTLGHEVGDKLLRSVAERLRGSLRDAETIGRLGGDEFVVLLDGATVPCAPELVAERIVDVIGQPFDIEGCATPIRVTASIGIAAGPAATGGELLRDADTALYAAKAAGKNCYAVFQPEKQGVVQRRHPLGVPLATDDGRNASALGVGHEPGQHGERQAMTPLPSGIT